MKAEKEKFFRSRTTGKIYLVLAVTEEHVIYSPFEDGRILNVQCECPVDDFDREMTQYFVLSLVQQDCPVGG